MITQPYSFKAKIQLFFIASLAIFPLSVDAVDITGKPILAEGCGIFFVEETDLGGSKYLQAFELEEGSEFIPSLEVLVRTLRSGPQ